MSEWIPVSERLPGFGQFVIVAYTEAIGDERTVGAEAHYNDGVWTNTDRMKSGQPTHWMPLPEPPKATTSSGETAETTG